MTTITRQPGEPDATSTLLVLIATLGLVDLDRLHDAQAPQRTRGEVAGRERD